MTMEITDKNTVRKAVFKRPDDANKGTLGSLLSICGCYGMAGAAIMAGKAALRCGLGLLKTAVPKSIYPICSGSILESVYYPLSETESGAISAENTQFLLEQAENSSAVLIGCGMSVCDDAKTIVNSFIENCNKPTIIDADALNCIAGNTDILKKAKAQIIITPHPAEMARLIGSSARDVNSDRTNVALSFAREYKVVTLLKGAGTVIAAPDGRVLINHTGNSGMATGGSGDVLAGMISSLTAQGGEPFYCAAAGAYLHGLAGDIAAEKLGKISMLPTDMINFIPNAYKAAL